MLTHTWFLDVLLGPSLARKVDEDLFIHNVAPDMLTLHEGISSELTHGVARFLPLPEEYWKAAFVQFHLLVDDIAHYGKINQKAIVKFDPFSSGYTYRKGRLLIPAIIDFYKSIGRTVDSDEAAYGSHILIEMAFDQRLHSDGQELAGTFCKALRYTVKDKIEDFCKTCSWLYGIKPGLIAEALKKSEDKYDNREGMGGLSSSSGRIELYIAKFGLEKDNNEVWSGLESLLCQGVDMVHDYEDFLYLTLTKIRDSGFQIRL